MDHALEMRFAVLLPVCHYEAMKAEPEYIEGPEACTRFRSAMGKVLAVPHSEIQRRIEEHRKEAARNPHRRGPKPRKAK